MRVIIRGNWAPYVGTDYCDALGIFGNLADAQGAAEDYAYSVWEGEDEIDEETGEIVSEDEGPDYWVEEYDPDKHDGLKAGGGSFEDDFRRHES